MNQYFLYSQDNRTARQIELSKNITRELTHLNTKRILNSQNGSILSEKDKWHRKNYLYVCFSGIPPIKNEFDNLGVQGEKIDIFPHGLTPDISPENAKEKVDFSQLEKQAAAIHEILRHRADKPLVFVYHSFGNNLVSVLFRLYYNYYFCRVIGMISIGGYPIRFTPALVNEIQVGYGKTVQNLLENADSIYDQYVSECEKARIPFDKNKYSYICRKVAFSQGLGFAEMFSYARQLPPVLKCFIYGRDDQVILQENLSEVAIHYCYKRKFQPSYETKIKEILFSKYGIKTQNVQQCFIYNIPGGKHSLHWQKKFQPLISKIIDSYLSTIEQIYSESQK